MCRIWYRPLVFAAVIGWLLWWLAGFGGTLVRTDTADLLPAEHRLNPTEQLLLARTQANQDRQILLFVWGAEALNAAEQIARQWRQSGLFASLTLHNVPNLPALAADYQRLSFRVLPAEVRRQLFGRPQEYFQQRAQALLNPFTAPALLPADKDWLGFSRYAFAAGFPGSALQLQANGTAVSQVGGMTRYLLRAELKQAQGVIGNPQLLHLLQDSRQLAARYHSETAVAGSAIFAAEGRSRGEREGKVMTAAGLMLTLLLIGAIFRRLRVVAVLLPVFAGGVVGLAATAAVFHGIHILSLVIATSLIGLLLDFPLHWLGKSIYPGWQAATALAALRRPFFISMLITLIGYAFLLATDLPVLRQTAVFSLAALPAAWLCTLWVLPPLFTGFQPRENPRFAAVLRNILAGCRALKRPRYWLPAGAVILSGMMRINMHDDIRQWVGVPQTWLQQAAEVARFSGVEPAGQWFVVHAPSEDALLARDGALVQVLQAAKEQGILQDYSALSQWVLSRQAQEEGLRRLHELAQTPQAWQALTALGIPARAVAEALQAAAATGVVSVAGSLATPLAARWQGLYWGKGADGAYYAAVRLFGVKDSQALAAITLPGVRYLDKRQALNRLFRHTRNQALWLKAASYGAAWLILLAAGFSWRISLKIIVVPLGAAVCSVAVLAWCGMPVSLFVAFALLLISAVGMDYAVYAESGTATAEKRFAGMLPAAATTVATFGILGFSSTPAVAAFGLSVALGIFFSLLLATWLLPTDKGR